MNQSRHFIAKGAPPLFESERHTLAWHADTIGERQGKMQIY